MLAYQHAYHAGNLADVHKHALLAEALAYLVQKPKPLHYLDTHAGRGVYDLAGAEARKTGEAEAGILRLADWFDAGHPYRTAMEDVARRHGADAYPGSPAIAAALLRDMDEMTLVERHPGEIEHLRDALPGAKILAEDGWQATKSLTPPEPRRGLMLVDPSYELAEDFVRVLSLVTMVRKKWPVGILMVWYPILSTGAHAAMTRALRAQEGSTAFSEVSFPPAREGHRLVGSGLFVVNPPWGWEEKAAALEAEFSGLPASR